MDEYSTQSSSLSSTRNQALNGKISFKQFLTSGQRLLDSDHKHNWRWLTMDDRSRQTEVDGDKKDDNQDADNKDTNDEVGEQSTQTHTLFI